MADNTQDSLAKRVQAIEDREAIIKTVNQYGLFHDRLQLKAFRDGDPKGYEAELQAWEAQFTDDVEAVFSKGTRRGNAGMSATFKEGSPLLHFESGQWVGANIMIWNQTETTAEGRSSLHCTFVYQRALPDRNYQFGGFYDWKFRKVDGVWKISYIKPNTVWCSGPDYTGLGPRDKQGFLEAYKS